MSDPEVPRSERPEDVNDVVDRANAGLDAAAAAGADVPGTAAESDADTRVDPDLAAFEEAERAHPGTFSAAERAEAAEAAEARADAAADIRTAEAADARAVAAAEARAADDSETSVFDRRTAPESDAYTASGAHASEESAMADAAYAPARDAETQIVPSEPSVVPVLQQPIFVQAPEPPRERGNRGTAAGIGLLATLSFALLYLGAALGLGAIAGDVTGENIGEAALAPLTTWGFWVPVVVFFLGFWLLGAIINRGRWGLWVVFGILVGAVAYGGHILGQLFEAPFWLLTATESRELVGEQLLAPLAIAAFVFARELTIWFGAWVARSGARKTELNAEAQREYERTLEAGPTLSR
ncbi:MAG TPA: ABC transporter [Microbacterium sp.]|nr:ABC transporter [Microbacterium sp.]